MDKENCGIIQKKLQRAANVRVRMKKFSPAIVECLRRNQRIQASVVMGKENSMRGQCKEFFELGSELVKFLVNI